ncbi:MAG: mechanosensitive ion channel family protein [Colwellia sp.]|nr:mechanosensitive ion channel family protein [Colwellia sp.]MCW8865230.1 mechanosensitive ion channel family protein [Colwellia sp.]MCW9081296.1 mechanosensitive ion channel family protein [Colwellia sp.]
MKTFLSVFLCLFILLNVNDLNAQEQQAPKVSLKEILIEDKQAEEKSPDDGRLIEDGVPEDPYRRGQPRSSFQGFLNAAKKQDYVTASEYLDYRNLSSEVLSVGKEELARQFYVVLSRTIWVDIDSLSDEPQGNLNESNVPNYREFLGEIETKHGSVKLYLQHVPRKTDKVKIWKISNSTVAKVPSLSLEYAYTPLGEWLSRHLPPVSFLGVKLWQWLYFLYMIFVFFIVAKILTHSFSYSLKRVKPTTSPETLQFIEKPFSLLLTVILLRFFIPEENATHEAKAVAEGATLLTIAWLWVLFRFIDLMKVKMAEHFVKQDKPLAIFLLRPAGTVAKSIIAVATILIWFENLGFSATTLLAGLGIGGLAIALAAQKTVENIIGAITLYTSAPVRIGDFCRFGKHLGVVEEIGLRATRIRTLDRTVIYIANAKFIDMEIENFSERERIAFRPKMYLTPTCSMTNIDALLNALRAHFSTLDILSAKPQRAHIKACTQQGIELNILLYVKTTDFDAYLNTINELNLTILSLLEQHQCQLQVVSDRVPA